MKIHILSPKVSRRIGGINKLFYPLHKWKKQFKKEGITFSYFTSHLNKNILECDYLILDFRYYEQILKGNYLPKGLSKQHDENFIIDFLKKAKDKGISLALLDSVDSVITRASPVIPYVDWVVKKQVYKDLNTYSQPLHYKRPWTPPHFSEPALGKEPVRESDLQKFKTGWNLALWDYRYFPDFFEKVTPVEKSRVLPGFYRKVNFKAPSNQRHLLTAYRIGLKNVSASFQSRADYQRVLVKEVLDQMPTNDIIVGGKISRKQYLKELQNSKIAISPFGYGEICYRDFEAIFNGCLLLKPSMKHLDTWPDLYREYETYVPFKWDCSDLNEKLQEVRNNYLGYIKIIENSQHLLKKFIYEGRLFINQLRSSFNFK